MKLSDYIASYLAEKGIKVVFGYIGGMITHLVDSIALNPDIEFIQTYHEQTAAIAAEGYAKESGNFGVAISTSGPGATNMITGIADAYFDSIPVLYITGQVNTYEYKYDKPIRQQGFQETDVVSIVKPITKYAKLLDKADDIKYELDKALHIALSGRKGPVLLDIPMDIQRTNIDVNTLREYTIDCDNDFPSFFADNDLLSLLRKAKKPMFLLGAGCLSLSTHTILEEILKKSHIPVVTSLMGRGAIDETYQNYLGMIGSYGNRCANMGIAQADLLIAMGTRLDTRQTGAMLDGFIPEGRIIHVNIDNSELEYNRLKNRIKINTSVDNFLQSLIDIDFEFSDYSEWNLRLHNLRDKYNQNEEVLRFVWNKSPYRCMQFLNSITAEDDIICADIGQNQMWAAQTINLKKGQRFITSGGLAPMGFSLPVAIGAAFASRCKKNIYSINGDGGFHIAIQSLMLISQYELPLKVFVLNNQSLGMITQFQHLYFDNRMAATTKKGGYLVPDIKSLARAYNIPYYCLTENLLKEKDIIEQIKASRYCIVEFFIEDLTTVSPKLEFNKPISSPSPQLKEDELNH